MLAMLLCTYNHGPNDPNRQAFKIRQAACFLQQPLSLGPAERASFLNFCCMASLGDSEGVDQGFNLVCL